jgi:hypothetical protein
MIVFIHPLRKVIMRPKNSEVIWDYYFYNTTPDFSYRVEISREDRLNHFKLRYITQGKDKTKYFYGETAWMDITRFIHDLGDWSFNIDSIEDDLVESYIDTLVELKGSC